MTDDILIIGIDNWPTGTRPDGIDNNDIRNGDLICPGGQLHQRLDAEPDGDYEVRVVKDGRDISQYDSWTVHFADGSAVSVFADLQSALSNGKTPTDVEGVVPVPAAEIAVANGFINAGLPAAYRGDVEMVEQWAADNGVSLPADSREKLKAAYDAGCPYVSEVEPPEV